MKKKDKRYTYFQPGEMLFLISHSSNLPINPAIVSSLIGSDRSSNAQTRDYQEGEKDYDAKIEQLIGWSNTIAQSLGLNLNILRNKSSELHFPGTLNSGESPKKEVVNNSLSTRQLPKADPRGAFSLIPVDVKFPEPNTELSAKAQKQDPNSHKKPDRDLVERRMLTRLTVELYRQREKQPLNSDFTLEAVSLNWLSSPCSEWGGGGGPGGIPIPYYGDRGSVPYSFELPSTKNSLKARLSKEGKGVVVAILDTAPCLQDLAAAYERYHKVNPENQNEHHPLIEDLLRPNGPLTVHPASYEDLLRMRAVHLRDHDYEMSDHGLFVAGIVHDIARQAEIHLYEVLNTQGVGDIVSIAKGLWEVLNSFKGRPLVVNCSLVINIPLLNQPIINLDEAIDEDFMKEIIKDWDENKDYQWLTEDLLSAKGKEWLESQGFAIQWICDQVLLGGSLVIAAAGNDWRRRKDRPDPRYPAAYDSVLGVGALPKDTQPNSNGRYEVSNYSNIADRPKCIGVTTLGGEPGRRKGVLGIYIGEFPNMEYRLQQYPWPLWPLMWLLFCISWGNCVRPKNKSRWAWWCGTSFATPIISGLAAAVLSDLGRSETTQSAIDTMYSVNGIRQHLTPDEEDGVEGITQVYRI